jgi:hypothetical protein
MRRSLLMGTGTITAAGVTTIGGIANGNAIMAVGGDKIRTGSCLRIVA